MGIPKFMKKPLKRDVSEGYGSNAKEIYTRGCELYGWDESKANCFGYQTAMFAPNATPEGYSVWFLTHSNLSGTYGGTWNNKIEGSTIEETWTNDLYSDYFRNDNLRITFAKKRCANKDEEYVFIGLYEYVSTKDNVKIYRKISDVYQ